MTKQVLQQALDALELAVRQNSHDMILTGEELRDGEAAIEALRYAQAQQGEQAVDRVAVMQAIVDRATGHRRAAPAAQPV